MRSAVSGVILERAVSNEQFLAAGTVLLRIGQPDGTGEAFRQQIEGPIHDAAVDVDAPVVEARHHEVRVVLRVGQPRKRLERGRIALERAARFLLRALRVVQIQVEPRHEDARLGLARVRLEALPGQLERFR